MKRPLFMFTICLFLFHCNQSPSEVTTEAHTPGPFAHTVYFWLNNPDSETDRNVFETSLKLFVNTSKYITTKHIGVPATTKRGVIDNSYTYSLLLTFSDKAMQDKYQAEPAHKQFLKESEALWNKVIVYDSETILK